MAIRLPGTVLTLRVHLWLALAPVALAALLPALAQVSLVSAPEPTRVSGPRLLAGRLPDKASLPPAFKIASSGLGAVRFWLSKPSTVEMRSPAGRAKRLTLYGGWYNLGWKLAAVLTGAPLCVQFTKA